MRSADAELAADYEAALGQLTGLVGELVLVTFHAPDGTLVGSSGGELIDALPLSPGSDDESVVFRVLGGSTFILDRAAFRGWRLDLDEDGFAGMDLDCAGAKVRVTRYGS